MGASSMSKHELDDAAYEALKAHPVMVEEAMTNQDGAFWAIVAQKVNGPQNSHIGLYIRGAVDGYVKEQVEDLASDEEISVNEAIHKMLNRCNGGK